MGLGAKAPLALPPRFKWNWSLTGHLEGQRSSPQGNSKISHKIQR